jgi:ATP-dependent Clp protease ATP-binding subunit ClpC
MRQQYDEAGPGSRRAAVRRGHDPRRVPPAHRTGQRPGAALCPCLCRRAVGGRHHRDAAGLRDRYEAHHKVTYSDAALVAAVKLSDRYVTDRQLPDKAIDLIDEAAAKLRVALHTLPQDLKELKKEIDQLKMEEEEAHTVRDYERAAIKRADRLRLETDFDGQRTKWQQEQMLDEVVDEHDIADVVASWTGIPVNQLLETEAEKLLHMEERLHERIVGQERAVAALADAIRRSRSGLSDPRRPIGSFVFLGSSGVGKTELAKALAEFLFDDEDALIRIDMSEYREQHTVSRLFGAPPATWVTSRAGS